MLNNIFFSDLCALVYKCFTVLVITHVAACMILPRLIMLKAWAKLQERSFLEDKKTCTISRLLPGIIHHKRHSQMSAARSCFWGAGLQRVQCLSRKCRSCTGSLVCALPSPFNTSLGLLRVVQQIILVSYPSMLGVSQQLLPSAVGKHRQKTSYPFCGCIYSL